MHSDIEYHLETLSIKYQKGSVLSQLEAEEASRLLREALAESPEGVDLCLRFAVALPPEPVAYALAESWSSLDDAQTRQIIDRLQGSAESGAKRLRVWLSAALQSVDLMLARRVLLQVCPSLVNTKDQFSKKSIPNFKNALLDERNPALLEFNLSDLIQAEVSPLLTCVVAAVFQAPDAKTLEFSSVAPRVLEWLWRQGLLQKLKPRHRANVLASAASWPLGKKHEFAAKFDPLPSEFEFLIKPEPAAGAMIEQTPTSPEVVLPDQTPSTTVVATSSLSSASNVPKVDEPKGKCSARELLALLGEALEELEGATLLVRSEADNLEATVQTLRTKVSAGDNDLLKAEVELREVQEELNRTKVELTGAQRDAENMRQINERFLAELANANEKHDREADALAGRVKIEFERGIETFKNSLADKLRLEWRDFEDVSGLAMTSEIGESHRRQMREMFALLEREGIQMKV